MAATPQQVQSFNKEKILEMKITVTDSETLQGGRIKAQTDSHTLSIVI